MPHSVGKTKTGIAWSLVALLVLLGGCAVGPDFHSPAAPAAATGADGTPVPVPAQTASAPTLAGEAQRFSVGQDVSAAWWSLFHDEALDRLVRTALANSPTLGAAQAALREAQENYAAEAGSLLVPNVSGSLGATRERLSIAEGGVPGANVFYLYNASVNVSYTVDAFGSTKRTLENLAAAVDYQRFQVEAAYLALTANVVTTAIQEASLRGQLQATQDVLRIEQHYLDVIDKQFAVGAVSRSSVLTQQTQVAQTRATIPPLEKSLAQTRHQLSVYVGKLPNEGGVPEFRLDTLQLPQDLPLSLPSALVRQRPDIRASEALLHEASAQVGVATANLYPQITLSSSLGGSATRLRDLFDATGAAWTLASGLTQPIFDGGALRARKRSAEAAYDAAAEQYRSTVLSAFQNVADSLRAIEWDAATLNEQANSAALAKATLDLSTRQYRLGSLAYLNLLDAQRTYEQTRVSLVQAQAARHADTVALFQSLGGGWWTRPDLPDVSRPGTGAVTPTPSLAPLP